MLNRELVDEARISRYRQNVSLCVPRLIVFFSVHPSLRVCLSSAYLSLRFFVAWDSSTSGTAFLKIMLKLYSKEADPAGDAERDTLLLFLVIRVQQLDKRARISAMSPWGPMTPISVVYRPKEKIKEKPIVQNMKTPNWKNIIQHSLKSIRSNNINLLFNVHFNCLKTVSNYVSVKPSHYSYAKYCVI